MVIIGLTISLIAIVVIHWGADLNKTHPDFLNVAGIITDLMGLVGQTHSSRSLFIRSDGLG